MAGETPKKNYPQPLSGQFGGIYRGLDEQLGMSSRPFFLGALDGGAMGSSPRANYLGMPENYVTPQANPAAVRAYTRNAPYMEEFMSDPQTMMAEMYRLQQALKETPNDPVSEYRLRILRQALGDVFGMLAPDEIESWHTFSKNLSSTPPTVENYTFTGRETTPQSRPMVQTMARRGR